MTTFSEFAAARLDEVERDAHESGDPAAAADVQFHRDILAEHGPDDPRRLGGWDACCRRCITRRGGWQEDWAPDQYPCQTLRLMFAAWASHPDYDPAWAPAAP